MKTLHKQTAKKIFSALAFYLMSSQVVWAQSSYGEIRGTIKNDANEDVPLATIQVLQGTRFVGGTQADMNGQYTYKPLEAGSYELVVQESGHQTTKINKIKVGANATTYLNVTMAANTLTAIDFTVAATERDYTNTGVDQNVYQMKSLSSEEILQQASGNRGDIISLLPTMTSEIIEGADGGLHFRGGRSGSSAYFVDGTRVNDIGMLPGLSIENLTVFSGGIPAAYGDTAGGVVIVTTKSYFSGIRDKRIRTARANENYEKQQKERKQAASQNQLKDVVN